MGKASRDKGARGERELSGILREYGWDTHRTAQHMGKTGGAADVEGLEYIHIESKRTEALKLYAALEQAIRDNGNKPSLPAVFHRRNEKPWVVIMRLDDWIKLYAEYYTNQKLDDITSDKQPQ